MEFMSDSTSDRCGFARDTSIMYRVNVTPCSSHTSSKMGLMMACPLRFGPPGVLVLVLAGVAEAGLEMVEALLLVVVVVWLLLDGRRPMWMYPPMYIHICVYMSHAIPIPSQPIHNLVKTHMRTRPRPAREATGTKREATGTKARVSRAASATRRTAVGISVWLRRRAMDAGLRGFGGWGGSVDRGKVARAWTVSPAADGWAGASDDDLDRNRGAPNLPVSRGGGRR